MKQVIRLVLAFVCVSFVPATPATAQVPYNEGAVERVVLIHILPGRTPAFLADIKTNVEPIWKAQKAAGMIVDYQMFFNSTRSGADDWDFGYSLTYKGMASLDGLADKAYAIRMKQYGDSASEQKVIDKRVENGHVVSSMLLRDITLR